jgi:hypothetical protein
MKPTHDDLCAAIIVIGAAYTEPAIADLGPELHRLAELGVAQWSDGSWELTPAGARLLRPSLDGNDIEPLE